MAGSEAKRAEIHAIINDFLDQGWKRLELTWNDYELQLSKVSPTTTEAENAPAAVQTPPPPAPGSTSAGQASPAAPLPEADAPTDDGGVMVAAPMMGTFYIAASPGADPFVAIGSEVVEGQSLCIVEVMKLMTRVESSVNGVVTAIHVENGQLVVEGDPLFTIAPAQS